MQDAYGSGEETFDGMNPEPVSGDSAAERILESGCLHDRYELSSGKESDEVGRIFQKSSSASAGSVFRMLQRQMNVELEKRREAEGTQSSR